MIRPLALALAALAAAPACFADGGPIQSGEHEGFSRIVMQVDPTTEWSLELTPGGVAIFFPRKEIAFGTADVFRLIPRSRIQAVESRVDPDGTRVAVSLGCDCRVSTVFVNGRWLALDIGDRDASPPSVATADAPAELPSPEPVAETAEARAIRERAAVGSAEEILIRQIERAAGQGLIRLADAGAVASLTAPVPTAAAPEAEVVAVPSMPDPPARPAAGTPPVMPLALDLRGLPQRGPLAALLDHDQIRATTVFDRDRAQVAADRDAAEPGPPPECRADEDFAFGSWASSQPAYAQITARAGRLLGEFDAPDPEVLVELARLHLRFGLGAEAEQLLAAFPVAIDGRPLLVDLARVLDDRPPAPGGPLAVAAACPGAHGLWLAVGGAAPAFRDAAHFAGVAAAFGELPPDLRALVGPALIGRLIDQDQVDAARLIYDTTIRPEAPRTAALQLGEARLVAAEGNPDAAARALGDLVEANAPNAPDALAHLARLAVDARLPLPDRLVSDLGAAVRQYRAGPRGAEFRGLLAEALAERGDIGGAMREVRGGLVDWPRDPHFPELAVALLAGADPEQSGAAAYAEAVLGARSLLPDPGAETARAGIARHLLDLGLAAAARELIAGGAGRGEATALLIDADAAVALGETAAARAALDGLDGPEAAELRARAFARDGAFDAAVATLVEAGLDPEAAAYAWPSGDWVRASAAAGDDPERLALAGFMQARADPAAAPPPPADPAGAAVVEPLPGLEPASLSAARRLLATGREVEDFVASLLAD